MEGLQDIQEAIHTFEQMLEDIRRSIAHRRTMLKNADKKLQEFQDMMYAMLIEDEHSKRRYDQAARPDQKDDETG